MPISEKGSTMTVSCPKFDTNTGTFHPDGSTSVRPTTKPVFSENKVRPSSRPLGGNDRPPTVCVRTLNSVIATVSQDTARIHQAYQQLCADNIVRDKAIADLTAMVREYGTPPATTQPYGPPTQCRTASECGGIEQCPTVNTRPDSAASLRCSWSNTPPSVNSNPFLMSNVCGRIDPRVSVPIMASLLKSHTRIGNSVLSPKNETTQDEHPEMLICEPFAPRNFLTVGRRSPTGAPATTRVL